MNKTFLTITSAIVVLVVIIFWIYNFINGTNSLDVSNIIPDKAVEKNETTPTETYVPNPENDTDNIIRREVPPTTITSEKDLIELENGLNNTESLDIKESDVNVE